MGQWSLPWLLCFSAFWRFCHAPLRPQTPRPRVWDGGRQGSGIRPTIGIHKIPQVQLVWCGVVSYTGCVCAAWTAPAAHMGRRNTMLHRGSAVSVDIFTRPRRPGGCPPTCRSQCQTYVRSGQPPPWRAAPVLSDRGGGAQRYIQGVSSPKMQDC